ncbi:hypothetical protein VIGAN_01168300 [Vigna angularis var. angularis]|uniref:Uncharacterized protein n=1 Tax=Vigna angularis var. angularis TaxID=157739 RepID=A0A0S3R0P6_PHAAN|nr:uncharacterized protein LOC108319390 [Vigna angularis]BAT74086.1 hypothetical protein VIGAN_01168300 [Vigna angularis var. angularis]
MKKLQVNLADKALPRLCWSCMLALGRHSVRAGRGVKQWSHLEKQAGSFSLLEQRVCTGRKERRENSRPALGATRIAGREAALGRELGRVGAATQGVSLGFHSSSTLKRSKQEMAHGRRWFRF